MYKKFITFITALAVVGFTAGQAMGATVSLTQGNPILTAPAAVLNLDLVGTGFTTPVDGGAFTFSWDDTVLQYVGTAVANPPWDTAIVEDTGALAGTSNSVDFVFLGQSVGTSGPGFDIASISFNVIGAEGTASIIAFADSAFGGWVTPGGVPLDPAVTYIDGQVQVSAVPVPAAVWLFGSGLLGLVGVARRRSAHAV